MLERRDSTTGVRAFTWRIVPLERCELREQVRSTRRPLILTQHGRSAAVLMGVADYEALVDESELLRDIRQAEQELAEGKGIPHEEVVASLKARLGERLGE